MIPSTPADHKQLRQPSPGPDQRPGIRILTITLEREVAVTQRVTHTIVVPCGTSEEIIRDQVLNEIHGDEWHDKTVGKSTTPVVIDCREVPIVLGVRPGHWSNS